jgi:hypothetical protein
MDGVAKIYKENKIMQRRLLRAEMAATEFRVRCFQSTSPARVRQWKPSFLGSLISQAKRSAHQRHMPKRFERGIPSRYKIAAGHDRTRDLTGKRQGKI